MKRFNDIVPMRLGRRVTDTNGFQRTPAVITQVGVQQYTKDQLGLAGISGSELVAVFRPPETVFHEDTIESFKHLPVTDGHPAAGVSPVTAKMFMGGHIGEDVIKHDDLTLGATIHLTDQRFIDKSKGSQTSAGYDAAIVKDSGEFNGVKYDYRFDGPMIGNHLALVDRARCGEGCRVLDEENNQEENNMDKAEVQTMIDAALLKQAETSKQDTATIVAEALVAHQVKQDAIAVQAKADTDAQKVLDDAAAEQVKTDAATTSKRVDLLVKTKPLLGDKFDDKLDNKALLILTLGDAVQDADSKSEDYLMAMLDAEIGRRAKAGGGTLLDSAIPTGGVVVKAI